MTSATTSRQRVLLVDDSPSALAILEGVLSEYCVEKTASGEKAIESVLRAPPDLILLDVRMPGMDGYETCRRIKQMEEGAEIPVIFVTGLNDTEDEAQGFALGAVDFISKPIRPAIVRARIRVHLELKAARDTLHNIAMSDGLTGVANRRHFEARVQTEWNRALRHCHPLSLVMADVDYFKNYNDFYGHMAGDECLRNVATGLRDGLRRASDLVARYGGEEFVCLMPELSHDEAAGLADSLRHRVENLFIPHDRSNTARHVTVSMGLATMTPDATHTWNDLLAQADQALYQAKRLGRNRLETVLMES